jgi:hypothetical protein
LDAQAGYTSRTREMEYARSTEDHRQVGRDTMYQYFLISKEWHELLLSKSSIRIESSMEIEIEEVLEFYEDN